MKALIKLTTKRIYPLILACLLFGLTASTFGVSGKPSEVSYVDGAGHRLTYSFTTGSNGHLVVNYWDGFSWRWADQGVPSGTSAVWNPSAVTYLSGSSQQIYVFGASNTGHLVVNYWDGSSWRWADQGLPPGASAVWNPSAVTYLRGSTQLIYVFAESHGQPNNGHLVLNYWDGSSWRWADQGVPSGASAVLYPSTISFSSNGSQLIYAFAQSGEGHLVVNYWDGLSWRWADQGSR